MVVGDFERPIVLVGMMGAGKSHVGGLLAKTLALDFYDSDRMIEEKAGMSVVDIFENFGEKKFRESEHKTILELLACGPCIVATGGGALLDSRTMTALKARSFMVWVQGSLDVLWERVQRSQSRPLLNCEDGKERLAALFAAREALYAQAHFHVSNDFDNDRTVVSEVIKALSVSLNEDSVQPLDTDV